jgi:hypothetical protein
MKENDMKKIAGELYRNRHGNCAQAVAAAWQLAGLGASQARQDFADCGGGRAPAGVCGALHAANRIAGAQRAEQIAREFAAAAGGHTTCREIRSARVLSCAGCVELAAELLENHAVGMRP